MILLNNSRLIGIFKKCLYVFTCLFTVVLIFVFLASVKAIFYRPSYVFPTYALIKTYVSFVLMAMCLIILKWPTKAFEITKRIVLFSRLKHIFTTLIQKVRSWVVVFSSSEPKEKWKMLRLPIFVLILIAIAVNIAPYIKSPKVVSSFPDTSSVEVPLDSTIEFSFDRPVNKKSVESAFRIDPVVKGNFEWKSNNEFMFKPEVKFERSTSYKVKFVGSVLSSYLIPSFKNPNIFFTTLGNPSVIVASPVTESLESISAITVIFDRPMIPLTTFVQRDSITAPFTIEPFIGGVGRWLGTTAYEFRPDEPYKNGTYYKVVVASGIRSVDGGELKDAYSWQFVGGIPRIESVYPESGYLYANPNTELRIKFNQKVNLTELEKRVVNITGGFRYDSKDPTTVIIKPSSPLARNMNYTIVINQGVVGMEGVVGTESDYSWNFSVANFPSVVSTTPKNGDINVKEENSINVEFRTPMDEESLKKNVRITPAPDGKLSMYFSEYNNALEINTLIPRSLKYSVTILGNALDQYGYPLGKDYTFTFNTAPFDPSVTLLPNGTYFASFNQGIIPRIVARVTNTSKVDYTLYELPRDQFNHLYKLYYDYTYRNSICGNDLECGNWQKYDTSKLKIIKKWFEKIDSGDNVPVNVVTKVSNEAGQNISSGTYFLDARLPNGVHDNMVMIVSKTSLTVKHSTGQIFVWAIDQSTGMPVSGMDMEVFNQDGSVITSGRTNADGVWFKDVNLYKDKVDPYNIRFLISGKKGNDFVISATNWDSGISHGDFGMSYYANTASGQYKLHLILDTPIYRPGQVAYFRGVVKKDTDGKFENLKPGELVVISVKDQEGQEIYTVKIPINSFGSFNGNFQIGEKAGLGNYSVRASYNTGSFAQDFQVEEYRKPEFLIKIDSSKPDYINNETADVTINSSYYFGAPMPNTEVVWSIKRGDYNFIWNKDSNFDFSDDDTYLYRRWSYYGYDSPESEEFTQSKGITDSKGDLSIKVPLEFSKYENSQRVEVEANVTDKSNQVAYGSSQFIVHKGDFYIGVRPANYINSPNEKVNIELVTVNKSGKEDEDKNISVSFYRRTWDSVQEKDPEDGNFYWVSKPKDTLVDEQTVVTSGTTARALATFTPKEGGTYKVVAVSKDKFGNRIKSSSYVWVYGDGFETQRENNDRIPFLVDKTDYFSGDNVDFFAVSPYVKTKSLFTVERGKVIDYFISDTGGNSQKFKLKLKDSYSPNVYVGVVVPKGGSLVKEPPEFKMGYVKINVTDRKNKMVVNIIPDKLEYRPGDTLKVDLGTKDLEGTNKKADLVFIVVDKAIWDLSDITFADIYDNFYQHKANSVFTSNFLTISMDRVNANTDLGAKGGSGGGGGDGLFDTSRKDFPKTAYWNPNIVTDSSGKAHIEVKLPDSLTTWKLIAVANTEGGSFGSSLKEVIVSKDLLIRPFVPRFLSNGDEVKLGAIVLNRNDTSVDASIEFRSQNLTIQGDSIKKISVPAGGQVKVIWDVTVKDSKEAKIGFMIKDANQVIKDAVELTLPVLAYYTPETIATSGQVKDISDELVRVPKDILTDRGGLKVSVSPQFGASNLGAIDYIKDYPYACGEQISSRLLASLSVLEVMKKYNLDIIEGTKKQTLEVIVNSELQAIASTQNPDGGWSWWVSEYKISDPFISAYTYHSLRRAFEMGYTIPQASFSKAEAYLINTLSGHIVGRYYNPSLDQQAYIIYVLKNKSVLGGYMSNLWEKRFALSIDGRAKLAMAMREVPAKRNEANRLKNEVLSLVRKTSTSAHWEEKSVSYDTMGSDLSTTATVTKMLLAFDSRNPLIDEAIRYIGSSKRNGTFGSTISTAHVLEMVSDYISSKGGQKLSEDFKIDINGKNLTSGTFDKSDLLKMFTFNVNLKDLLVGVDNKVRFSRSGSGNMYYNLDLKYYLPFTEVKPINDGFTVIREFVDDKGKVVVGGKINEGSELWVRLIVVTPASRNRVIIEDPLAAGLESINESLKNVITLSSKRPASSRKDVNPYSQYYFYHKEFRDSSTAFFADYLPAGVYEIMYKVRATTPGKYHYAPARAYEMYTPDVSGHSDGGWLEILPR